MQHSAFMFRCIDLARKGAGYVAPNPLVGAVLVHEGRIIGEGWHERYGEPHAEVNCIQNVSAEDQHLIAHSHLYVSLEPCAHMGKTPPCADLIIAHRIPQVVIGTLDPFPAVNGKGVEKLMRAGVDVITGVEEEACKELNRRFLIFHNKKRPYIVLKWAQSANGKMATDGDERLMITNDLSNRLVHRWRSEEAAILVGTRTALLDDPALTTRLWSGRHPLRAVLDMDLRLPPQLKLFNRKYPTIVFNAMMDHNEENLLRYRISRDEDLIDQLLQAFHLLNIQSVIVEGGAMLLQCFIDHEAWDEIRVITNTSLHVADGLRAPEIPAHGQSSSFQLANDLVNTYLPL